MQDRPRDAYDQFAIGKHDLVFSDESTGHYKSSIPSASLHSILMYTINTLKLPLLHILTKNKINIYFTWGHNTHVMSDGLLEIDIAY